MKQSQQEQESRPRQAREDKEEEEEVVALRWRQYPGPETDSAKNGIGKRGGGKLEGTEESTERTLSTGNVHGEDEEVEIIEEIEEELDVEGVLRKQNTHDLICPYCRSSITRTVILRRRIIPLKPEPAVYPPNRPAEVPGEVITGPNSPATPTPAPDEPGKDEEPEEPCHQMPNSLAIKCLSCLSVFIPTGSCFGISHPPEERPVEDQIPSDRTKCWLFGIFKPGEETPVEPGSVGTTDPNVIADPDVEAGAIPSEPRGLEILKSIVYGGLIESITSLGVVTSAAGGGASTLNILALGLANLITGLIILIQSLRDLKNDPSGAGGVTSETSTREDRYQELLGRRDNFCLHTTVSILSYLIFGLVPPVVYGFSFRQSNDTDLKLAAVAAASFVCIILLAIGKAYVAKPQRSYFGTVLFYVIAGFSASGVSFLVGELVRKLLEKLGWFESSSDLIMPLLEAKPFEGAWASF